MKRTVYPTYRTIAYPYMHKAFPLVRESLYPLTCEHQGLHLLRTRFAVKPKAPV